MDIVDEEAVMEMHVEVFCCYAREDQLLLNVLKSHLMPLQRQGLITVWADTDINAGQEWEKEINKHLNRAEIVLLLVSPDFIASDYCFSKEMQQAMKRHERGEAHVIPIILRPVYWQGMPFGKLQALPRDGKPIKSWTDPEDAFLDVVKGILAVIDGNNTGISTNRSETFIQVPPSKNVRGLPPGELSIKSTVDEGIMLIQRMKPQLETAFAKGDWLDVIRKVEFLIKKTPWLITSPIYRLQGLALFKVDEVEKAQEALDTALALAHDSEQRFTLLDDYVTVFTAQDKWNEAQKYIKEALQLTPRDPVWRMKQMRYRLLTLIYKQLAMLEKLYMTDQIQIIQLLKKRILAENCRILFIGAPHRGKSTLVNALLGQEVLPRSAVGIIAIISIVRWGEIPRALLYPKQSRNSSSTQGIEVPVVAIEKYFDIKYDSISFDYLHPYENPYERIEIFLPLDFCRSGFEIISTPGLNEVPQTREDAIAYLSVSDAVVFVISCLMPVSGSERAEIDYIRESGHKDIFFVCNFINQVKPKEQEGVKQFHQRLLAPLTNEGHKSIFFVDALLGLEGRLEGDQNKLDQSGVLSVEKALKSFLVLKTVREKFSRFADTLMHSLTEAFDIVHNDNAPIINELSAIKEDLEAFIQQISNT